MVLYKNEEEMLQMMATARTRFGILHELAREDNFMLSVKVHDSLSLQSVKDALSTVIC